MALNAWATFYDWVLPELPGATAATPLVDKAILEICRDFCERSWVHRVELTPIDVVGNTPSYALATSDATNLDVAAVLALWFNGQKLDPKSLDDLPTLFQPQWQTIAGTPEVFTQYDQGHVTLVPMPSTALAGGLRIQAALKPAITATGLQDWIFARWVEDIAKGIKAKLMIMAGKPWSSPDQGSFYQAQFDAACDAANVSAAKAFGRARVRSKSRFF
jgi:hypothetical protein